MSMFCYQCQETVHNEGCTMRGVCGKTEDVANIQDLLIWILKGTGWIAEQAREFGNPDLKYAEYIKECLFATITNANFDFSRFEQYIPKAIQYRDELKNKFLSDYQNKYGKAFTGTMPEAATWYSNDVEKMRAKAREVGILSVHEDDIRSLQHLMLFGLKGICAYSHHASVIGYQDDEVNQFLFSALADTQNDKLTVNDWVGIVMKTGHMAAQTMALLDKANTETYGHPEPTKVNLGVGKNPGILVSGHDLKDLDELLQQTEGKGIDIYTHSEMLPANYYPALKKYKHLHGNYGGSWWHQQFDFDTFNGPVLLTTNCLVQPKESYKDRVFTTSIVGFDGLKYIEDRKPGQQKDFSAIIAMAKNSPAPKEIETGEIIGGFAHNTVMNVADKVIEAVKAGKIKRFIVMAGCDGRLKEREYFTQVAEQLPKDTVILTAGCAKYRYIKLNLGDIDGIPRVLDAGQCNDSYSLAIIAMKLRDAFGLQDVNDLPLSFDIGWYEQKAVAVLLAVLALGFKNLRLGPTLPAFISPNVAKVLVENFNIMRVTTPEEDISAMMNGK
jgi:hydroxylamine reductase